MIDKMNSHTQKHVKYMKELVAMIDCRQGEVGGSIYNMHATDTIRLLNGVMRYKWVKGLSNETSFFSFNEFNTKDF